MKQDLIAVLKYLKSKGITVEEINLKYKTITCQLQNRYVLALTFNEFKNLYKIDFHSFEYPSNVEEVLEGCRIVR